MNKKAKTSAGLIFGVAALIILAGGVFAGAFFLIQKGSSQQTAVITGEVIQNLQSGVRKSVGQASLAFQFDAKDGANAQNDEAGNDFDIFYWNPDKQSDLKEQGYVDCSGATPFELDLLSNSLTYNLPESAKCVINPYNTSFSSK